MFRLEIKTVYMACDSDAYLFYKLGFAFRFVRDMEGRTERHCRRWISCSWAPQPRGSLDCSLWMRNSWSSENRNVALHWPCKFTNCV